MSNGNTENIGFEQRFLISWLIIGAAIGLAIGIAGLGVGYSLVIAFVELPFAGAIIASMYGGLGMLFDGAVRHNWRFREISHPAWVWHIYPIVALLDIVFSISLGFLINLVKGSFK